MFEVELVFFFSRIFCEKNKSVLIPSNTILLSILVKKSNITLVFLKGASNANSGAEINFAGWSCLF